MRSRWHDEPRQQLSAVVDIERPSPTWNTQTERWSGDQRTIFALPAALPPADLDGKPVTVSLPVGAALWRIHPDAYAANAVNPTAQPAIPGGARFDSLTGDCAYTYVGDTPEAAVAETLCRNLPVTGQPRLIPRKLIAGRVLSQLTVVQPLSVIALHGPHLAAIGQDIWLTKSDPLDYMLTRTWARALFAAAPSANGLLYRCRHNEDQFAWMLKTNPSNQVHPALEATGESVHLESPTGTVLIDRILASYNATLASRI